MGSNLKAKPADHAKTVGITAVFVAAAIAVGAGIVGAPGLATLDGLEQLLHAANRPLAATVGGLLSLFLLVLGLTSYFGGRVAALRREQAGLARLALVAGKTDQAVFLTDAEGAIEWINEGFTRMSGHMPSDAARKQPVTLLLGTLQNLNVTQRVREGLASQRIFTVEMLCSHRKGHRYWLSLNVTPVFDGQQQLTGFIGVGLDITARKRAEDEVARIGRRSELLLNSAGDGIFGIDIQGAITFVNNAAARLTGWAAGELIGKPVSTILQQIRINRAAASPVLRSSGAPQAACNPQPTATAEGGQDDLFTGAAFIDGTVQIGETDEFKARDGKTFPVEYTSTQVREGDNLLGSVVVFRDVTDRRESEFLRTRQARQAALRADVAFGLTNGDSLHDFLQRAMQCIVKHLDGAFARVWTLNAEGDMLELKASAGIYTHLDGPHARIPMGMFKVGRIAKEQMPAMSQNLVTDPDIIDKDWVVRERMSGFIGFPLFVEGRLVGVMAMFTRNKLPVDATELMGCVADTVAQGIVRKQTEEKVADQAALLDKSQDAIVVIDLSQRCTYWNKSAEKLYGWANQEIYGQRIEQVVVCEHGYFERAKALTLQYGEWHDNGCLVHRGDDKLTVESRWTLVTGDDGKPRCILIVNTDVTDQKKIEAQFLRTQRMESIGTLAGGIAHDLNNVLSPIMMSVEVLKTKFVDEQCQRMLSILETSARRGADMVKQVLTFARGVEGERVLMQPRHLLKDVAKIIGDTFPKTIEFKSEIPDMLWPLLGDATQLHQVLVNLAVNARDAMLEGGTLTIAAENYILESDIEHQGAHIMPGFFVLLRISDTGTGIPPDVLDKIFEPFFTTKEPGKGTGLGLSTVLGIVKSHGGFVQVQTEVNQGTTFNIYLPAQENIEMPAADVQPVDLPTGNGQLLLAVDDEAAVLTMTKETLETFGYRVITANDGAEAVAIFTEHHGQIAGVLTDMLMPHMDGPATIRVLKSIDPAVKIIAASGLMDAERVRDATGCEHIAFLMKPYTAEKLLTTIKRVLAEAA